MVKIVEGYEKGCKRLVVGDGQSGLAVLSTDAAAYLEAKGCEVTAQPIPKAIQAFNAPRRARLGCFT